MSDRRAGPPSGTGDGDEGTVLVLRALGLGDALTGVPALRGLRRRFPGHRLVLAAGADVGDWMTRAGVVDAAVRATALAPLRLPAGLAPGPERGPLVAVNLHGSGPDSHRVLAGAGPDRQVAFRNDEAAHRAGPAWDPAEHEVDRWCRLVRSEGGECGRQDLRLDRPGADRRRGGHVVVHPGAASGSRRWPVHRWRPVVRQVLAQGREVIVTGGPQERGLCQEVSRGIAGVRDLSGALSLEGLTRVVAGAGLLLAGDTGVAHLATAFGTPSVLLFGPTPPQTWGPSIDPHLHRVLWHAEPGYRGDPHADRPDPALLRIGVEEVVDAAGDLLARTSRRAGVPVSGGGTVPVATVPVARADRRAAGTGVQERASDASAAR